jgi:nucleotide-binding universal stress UspA family protein
VAALFNRLLLATEHSEFDTGSEALALILARDAGIPLQAVLPVLSNPEFEMAAPQLAAQADAAAARRREALQALARAQGVALSVNVRHGAEPSAEIVQVAQEQATDWIVIRRRGKRGLLANLLVGEMVSKVVAHAPCSVLVAPRGARLWQRRVLVGVDPLAADPATLAQACALAAQWQLPLQLVCVAPSDEARAAAQQALQAALLQARQHVAAAEGEVRVGRPFQELLGAAKHCGADLIVLARHRPEAPLRTWIGGVAQKVIGLAECPVFVHVHPTAATSA